MMLHLQPTIAATLSSSSPASSSTASELSSQLLTTIPHCNAPTSQFSPSAETLDLHSTTTVRTPRNRQSRIKSASPYPTSKGYSPSCPPLILIPPSDNTVMRPLLPPVCLATCERNVISGTAWPDSITHEYRERIIDDCSRSRGITPD